MAKTLDFNKVNRPTLTLVMQDDARTVIKVSTPTESLVREFQEIAPTLRAANAGDPEGITLSYDLAARMISCNRSFITVTGDELRGKYQMDLESLLIFFNAYADFMAEINNAKN